MPRLSFVNALGPFQTEVDPLLSGELIRETEPLAEDYSTATEAMIFDGETNSIRTNREYYLDYACQFYLYDFPFDTQVNIVEKPKGLWILRVVAVIVV